jgi:hypothetical protein
MDKFLLFNVQAASNKSSKKDPSFNSAIMVGVISSSMDS